jgi:hypothetical protein
VHKKWVEFTYPSSVIDGASRVMFPFPSYMMDGEDSEPGGWVDTEKASDDQIQEYVAFLRRCIKTARQEIDGLRQYQSWRAERTGVVQSKRSRSPEQGHS